jgi:ketosteroid isomerase-like protein
VTPAGRSKSELVRQMYDWSMADDVEGMLRVLAPDFELDVSQNVFNPGVWRGEDGALEWLRQTREVWDTPSYEIERLDELDDERVLSAVAIQGQAVRSRLQLTVRVWHLWTIRDGLVVRVAHFNDEASALRAAGLTEPPPSG